MDKFPTLNQRFQNQTRAPNLKSRRTSELSYNRTSDPGYNYKFPGDAAEIIDQSESFCWGGGGGGGLKKAKSQ